MRVQALAAKEKNGALALQKKRERQRAIDSVFGASDYGRPAISMQVCHALNWHPF